MNEVFAIFMAVSLFAAFGVPLLWWAAWNSGFKAGHDFHHQNDGPGIQSRRPNPTEPSL